MTTHTIPTLDEIRTARRTLSDLLPITRLVQTRASYGLSAAVYLKLESELPTRSFKVRGALHAVSKLMAESDVAEVVASSTGNHGAAVAYAAHAFGLRARIFLPQNPNLLKLRTIEELGAHVVEVGHDLPAAIAAAEAYARDHGAYQLADATDPWIPAGAGTLALEALEQQPDIERFVVPVGDTALIRGVAAAARAVKPDIEIVGVQSERAPSYAQSWASGSATPTETCDTIADGLATRTPLQPNVVAIRELVDDFVTVSEDALLAAVRALMEDEGVSAEPSGAAALAGLLEWSARTDAVDRPTAVVVSGGNLTPEIEARARA